MVDLNKKLGKNKKKKIVFGSGYGSELNQLDFLNKQVQHGVSIGVPHYFITNEGKVERILNDKYNSRFTGTHSDDDTVSILLEHPGYLKYDLEKNEYYDVFGTIYNKKDFNNVIWRDKCYWVRYDYRQLKALKELCRTICIDNKIKPKVTESNIKNKENLENTIIGRSNLSNFYLDPNPTFDFSFLKEIENGL